MSFASEKLYKGYLRRNMPTIVSKVKVREIIIHLPCLTDHDRETIEAKRETNGNYDGMVLLLDCLKRRENWPEQLIEALEACEHTAIAAEIRAEYNALRGINGSNPGSPSVTVGAHIHPPPPASPLPVPESGGKGQTAVAPPAEVEARPESVVHTSPPAEAPAHPQPPQSPAAPVPRAVSTPEPVPEPLQSTEAEVAPLPSTPPPSPETQHTPASTPPPLQRVVHAHQEPEENSEPDMHDITGDVGVIPDPPSTGTDQVNSVVSPPESSPVEQSETDTLSCSDSLQTTITKVSPPQSPAQMNSDVSDGPSFPTLTPDKPPVHDTTPPVDNVPSVVLEPEETSEPPDTQVVGISRQTEAAAAASPLPGAALSDDSVCLSKPGQLISIQQQNHSSPSAPATDLLEEPYSGNSDRLEISDGAPDTVTSVCAPAVSSTTGNSQCQENGVALNHNEPEENHYESPCQSLESQEVRMNVVHVSEEVSILNLDGQTSTPQAQLIDGEAAKDVSPASPLSSTATDTASSLNAHSSESYHPSEPAAADLASQLPNPEEKGASCVLTNNRKYFLAAAGVGAAALLVWKLKN